VDLVLVHGSYHGARCWDRLIPELEARGHHVSAVELPISDPAAGLDAYADAVEAACGDPAEPVLIGHSMAGLVIPIVAARRAIRRLIFVAAFLPEPGVSIGEQRQAEPIDGTVQLSTAEWTDLGDNVWMVGPNTATELFYPDASRDDAAWAVAQLRPQAYRFMGEPSPLRAWPDVPSDYIVCSNDRALNPAWAREAARSRLGIEPTEIEGGHSPFITRPRELAEVIDRALMTSRSA
jgi:hypothetical protein